MFVVSWTAAKSEKETFDELSQLVIPLETVQAEDPISGNDEVSETAAIMEDVQVTDNRERFAALYERNSDFVGWLCVKDTAINYPVMLTPDDPEYYLRRDYDGNKSTSGTPFIGEGCNLDSDNIIIYGHNMKNGTMFSDLTSYSGQAYFEEHPMISFDTLEQSAQYEIIAVFREKVHYQDETNAFRYYTYGGDLMVAQFDEYVANIKALSLYDTGLTASYGDQLITLSTCSYHTNNGRFVVVAKKIKQ